ncbi:hypothetical protein B0H17DRAFT_1177908 [Mycena rosella]|uniref:Uncharacterized protein n=1 Tax=Mycena rosella TaxID=1033263 RepID=A0AAD7DR93_MYCRO|nr:hypothetical protein B0H17DRAFT_1177908 [Mycena rosella]
MHKSLFLEMSSLTETVSCLTSTALPASRTSADILFGILIITFAAVSVHCASPMRLTRVLVIAMDDAEKAYLQAIESGKADLHMLHAAEMISSLQMKVSTIREATLRNSLSYRTAFCAFLKGQTLSVLQCIREVREVETHIEILKEEQLRDNRHIGAGTATRTVSLRRRRS